MPAPSGCSPRRHHGLGLSGRGWDGVVRVARTLADLDERERIGEQHVAHAVSLRRRGDR